MKEITDFSVDDKPPPSLKYIETPSALSKQYLVQLRHKQNQTELKKLEAKTGKVEIGIDRLMKKEEGVFRMGHAQ